MVAYQLCRLFCCYVCVDSPSVNFFSKVQKHVPHLSTNDRWERLQTFCDPELDNAVIENGWLLEKRRLR